MTLKGTVDFVIGNSASASLEAFTTIYNFFVSNTSSLGIGVISSFTGSGGLGFGYQNQTASRAGNNAWAVFRYNNATTPFYILIQAATGTNAFGSSSFQPQDMSSSGAPGVLQGNHIMAAGGGIGISVAQRADGGNPWNGTVIFDGNDKKGTPVWNTGSSLLYVWPRSNAPSGTYATNRENMMALLFQSSASTIAYRWHILSDENNLMILRARQTAMNSYDGFFFGKLSLNPNRQLTYPRGAYVCLNRSAGAEFAPSYAFNFPPFTPFSAPSFGSYATHLSNPVFVYGNLTGAHDLDGGVTMPTHISGTRACMLDSLTTNFLTLTAQGRNTCFPTATWTTYPPMVLAYEPPHYYGAIGSIDFFSFVLGLQNHVTESGGNLAVFGSMTVDSTNGFLKIVAPWSGSRPPGSGSHRTGSSI